MLRGLKHPKRLWGCTHSHTQEGRCRKSQMPSQYHSRTSTQRAVLEGPGLRDAAQGRQRLLGHSHSHSHARGIPGNTWSRAVATGLWLSQTEKPGCVLGDKQQPLSHCWPSHALEVFPLVLESRAAGPSWANHSSSFLPKAVFLPCLWQFCPGAGGEILLSVWFLQSAPATAVCALCQLPSCGGTSSI